MDPGRAEIEKAYAKIERQFTCTHEHRELRKRTIRDGSTTYVRQCAVCGNTSSPVKAEQALREAARSAIPAYDDTLEEQRREAKEKEYKKVQESFAKMRTDEYQKYLVSPQWLAIRRKVFARAAGLCEGCRECPPTQIHHLSYDHIGEEFLWELAAVCDNCHDRVHKQTET